MSDSVPGTPPTPGTAQPHATDAGAAHRAAVVIVASTRAAAGQAADTTGPVLVAWLRERGFTVPDPVVVADGEPVRDALLGALTGHPRVVVTTGGTGLSPTDHTPEMTEPLLERRLPALVHALAARGAESTATAVLSRGVAGTIGRTFVVNLPGSAGGVRDGIAVLDPILEHLCGQLEGRHEH